MAIDAERLRKVPLFERLTDLELSRLAGWLEDEGVDAGRHLAHEGASGYMFYVIDSGEARVLIDGDEVRRLGPGDFFDEAAILGDGHRTADVVAATELRVFTMFGTRFREMQSKMPELAQQIEATMRERLA